MRWWEGDFRRHGIHGCEARDVMVMDCSLEI
jgi:hypothetical protein